MYRAVARAIPELTRICKHGPGKECFVTCEHCAVENNLLESISALQAGIHCFFAEWHFYQGKDNGAFARIPQVSPGFLQRRFGFLE